MSTPFEVLPATFDGDEDVEISAEDVSETPDADEEMSDGLEDDADDDEELSLDDDEEDEDDDEDDDEEESEDSTAAELAELRAERRRIQYERQQQANQAYWDGIEAEAEEAFQWEEQQIRLNKHKYLDPEAYADEQNAILNARKKDWYKRFYASQNEARRQQYEKAAIPTYAARVATHFKLTAEQAEELLNYAPADFNREASKMARYNAREARLKTALKQARRGEGQKKLGKKTTNSGNGNGVPTKVRAGSMNHLKAIFANAAA